MKILNNNIFSEEKQWWDDLDTPTQDIFGIKYFDKKSNDLTLTEIKYIIIYEILHNCEFPTLYGESAEQFNKMADDTLLNKQGSIDFKKQCDTARSILEKAHPLYLGKYPITSEIDHRTDADKIIDFFNTVLGDKYTSIDVYTYEDLDEYCECNNVSKKYVLSTIKEYLTI